MQAGSLLGAWEEEGTRDGEACMLLAQFFDVQQTHIQISTRDS